MSVPSPILLTGATGYVGGRLLQALQRLERPVRVLARRPETLEGRILATTDMMSGDVLHDACLKKALSGIHTAFYLIPSDSRAAKNFAHVCAVQKVRKIIYLGGLGSQKVGESLLASGVPVVEFRASLILGPGSVSFEMIRAMVERFPVMFSPPWIHTLAQPIAVEDVIAYLLEAISYRGSSRVFEIGGPEPVSCGELMKEYARQRRLRRWMVSVPALPSLLSTRWAALAAPAYSKEILRLAKRLRAPAVVSHPQALQVFKIRPRGYPEAIAQSLGFL